MDRLSIEEIISKIARRETFDAITEDYSFSLKIDTYVPYVCAAVHDGNQFRKELWDNCLHSAYDRWYEEDPETKNMIASHPIVIAGIDSRFEYDLNRDPENAVFDTAWGKQLWKEPLPEYQKQTSLAKHRNFYKVVKALINKIENEFGCCIVYDIHSYNWRRWDRVVPTWNLGTSNIDNSRYGKFIESWRQQLESIEFPYEEIPRTAKINDTFQGNGYFLKFITSHFNNTLVLATEISKIYCHEYNHVVYPEIVNLVATELKKRLPEHAYQFYKEFKS